MKMLIAIPAYNEASAIGSVITAVLKKYPEADILVVDDGSTDNTSEVASKAGAAVVRHRINRGLGGGIGTAIEWAKQHQTDVLITIDADGQHDPADIMKVAKPIMMNQADIVIGSRLKSISTSMPTDRKILNTLANLLTFLLFGVTTSDSQSGFRGFSKKAIQSVTLRTQRMEVSSEIFGEIQRLGLKYSEVPIRVVYTDYSLQKGQSNSNSIPVLFRLIIRMFR